MWYQYVEHYNALQYICIILPWHGKSTQLELVVQFNSGRRPLLAKPMILSHLLTQKCAPAQVVTMYIVMTRYSIMQLQWNLCIEDTIGTQLVVLYWEVSLSQREILYTAVCGRYCRQCPHYKGVLYSVSFIERFHCTHVALAFAWIRTQVHMWYIHTTLQSWHTIINLHSLIKIKYEVHILSPYMRCLRQAWSRKWI